MPVSRLLLCFAFSSLAVNGFAAAPTTEQLNNARIAGLAWLFSHQSRDGSWKDASGASVQSTSAGIEALTNAGIVKGHPYTWALSYLQNTQSASVDALARQIVTLHRANLDVTSLTTQLNQWQNGKNAWGAYKGYGSSLPDTPLAMNALFQTGAFNTSTSYNTLCFGLLYAVRGDNSMSYIVNGTDAPASQSSGNLIPTAYAALALKAAPANTGWSNITCQRLENGSYTPTAFTLSTVLSNAVTWILSKQNASDGGFGDDGSSTVLETAVVYSALNQISASAYATQLGNAQGFLIAQQSVDGSWGDDPFATAMALQTLPALASGSLADSNSNGVPDVVETYLGNNPATPDHVAGGNGLSDPGTNTAQLLGSAIQNQGVDINLDAGGIAAPSSWKIASGYLPDGLSLDVATGQITGNPTTAGTFNFVYTVSDQNGQTYSHASQLVVALAGDVNGDGVVDFADLLLLQRTVLGIDNNTLTSEQRARADMFPIGQQDGVLDASDLKLLQQKILGGSAL